MREVKPEVRLLAKPLVDWDEVKKYLEEVGGAAWLDRMELWDDDAGYRDGERLVEFGGRLCYRSWAVGLNPNVKKVRTESADYFTNLLRSGHGSVIEHANYTFLFHNVSRVFTHELVRHRAGTAFSQESMRFVRLTDLPFWFPGWVEDDPELMRRCLEVLNVLERHQAWMSEHFLLDDEGVSFGEKKAKTSFMRRFAPDGVATGILFTANIRALRHVITMRTEDAAEEEIRLVFDQVAEIMRKEAPLLFGDFEVGSYRKDGSRAWVPGNRKV